MAMHCVKRCWLADANVSAEPERESGAKMVAAEKMRYLNWRVSELKL